MNLLKSVVVIKNTHDFNDLTQFLSLNLIGQVDVVEDKRNTGYTVLTSISE